MDLHCPLDQSGLLERAEWEKQLRDIQRNIEELYNEVKARREGSVYGPNSSIDHNVLNPTPLSTNTRPGVSTDAYGPHSNNHWDSPHPLINGGSDCSVPCPRNSGRMAEYCNSRGDGLGNCSCGNSNPACSHLSGYSSPAGRCTDNSGLGLGGTELEDILQGYLGKEFDHTPTRPCRNHRGFQVSVENKEGKNGSLNTALKEVAILNKDLGSYQDEIRKNSRCQRTQSVSFTEGSEEAENMKNKQHRPADSSNASRHHYKTEEGVKYPMLNPEAPPIPPRVTSWHLDSTAPEAERPVSGSAADDKCHSPCVPLDRKCVSPSVLRKFGAMLRENEGKTLTDFGLVTTDVPVHPRGQIGGCPRKPDRSNSSHRSSVQNCLPGAIRSSGKVDSGSGSPRCPRGQLETLDRDVVRKMGSVNPRGSSISGSSPPCTNPPRKARMESPRALVKDDRLQDRGLALPPPISSGTPHSLSPDQLDDLIELLDMLGIQQNSCSQRLLQTNCRQDPQQGRESSPVSITSSFSRPARPANRRPPSRWAGRVPNSTVTHFPSSCHTETVIM